MASPESRDVVLQFGTNPDNFALLQLKQVAPGRRCVRVTLQLWDIAGQRLARSQVGRSDCYAELDLE